MKNWERYIVLFIIGMALVSWPLLTIAGKSGVVATYFYIFTCWFIIIAGLILLIIFDNEPVEKVDQNV